MISSREQTAVGLAIAEAAAARFGAKPPPTRTVQPAKAPARKPRQARAGGSAFEQAHPRGRGGTWTVKQGASGAEVRRIQAKVGAKQDGSFGDKTAAAVRAFQKKNGLTVDGIVGRQTAAAMRGNRNAANVATGSLTDGDRRFLKTGHVHRSDSSSTRIGGPAKKAPAAKSEDSAGWNWRTQGNGQRGVTLKDGSTRTVNGNQYDHLKRTGRLSSKNKGMRGD